MSGAIGIGGAGTPVRVGIQVYMTTQQAIAGLQGLGATFTNLRNQVGGLDVQLRSLDRILTYMAAAGVAVATAQFVRMSAELERMGILLASLEGSFDKANQRMDQLIALASKAPFSLNAITDAFIKLKVAGIEPITGEGGDGPLKALLDGLAAFGATDQQLNRVALAIQQMAGKSVVSLEELRQQMGDAIPTAMRLMAEGLGMSVSQLISEISKGNIEATRGINALIEMMRQKYSGMSELLSASLGGAYRQLATQINRLSIELQRAGAFDPIIVGIRMLADAFSRLNDAIRDGGTDALSRFFDFLGANAGVIARFVSTINAFGLAIGALISSVFSVLSELPAEAVAGGLIGFILFGRMGIVVGALAGTISEVVTVFAAGVASLITVVGQIASALGLELGQFVTMGLLGAILFGRFGLFAVIALKIADEVIAGLRSRLANFIAGIVGMYNWAKGLIDTGSLSGASEAGQAARQAFLDRNASQPGQTFGNINVTPMQELFGTAASNARVNSAQVEQFAQRIQEATRAIREMREELAGRTGQINDRAGLTQQEIQQIEDLTKSYQRMEDRLASLNGREIDGFLNQQRRRLDDLNRIITNVRQRADEAERAGRGQEAAQLRAEAENLTSQAARFQSIMDKIRAADNSRIGERAANLVGRYANQLQQIRQQLEASMEEFTGGRQSERAEVERVEARFASVRRQLANLELQTRRLNGSEQERAATLQEILRLQELLNQVEARGREVATRRARREVEDAQREADQRIQDVETGLARERLSRASGLGAIGSERRLDILNRTEQYRNVIRQLDDSIRDFQRRLEDDPTQNWVQERITQLQSMREEYFNFLKQVGSFQEQEAKRTRDLWSGIGSAMEDALGRAFEVVITGTGSLKDVLNDLFRSVSRAVSQYLANLLFSQLGSMLGGGNLFGGGGTGGAVFSLFKFAGNLLGGSTGGGVKMAMGGVFDRGIQKFANGASFTNSVVSGPTLFNTGLMGEAGPEAIVPLTRVGGRLGVATRGGGDSFSISINAVDAASVRELFYREGSALVSSIAMRNRLNRGVR